MTQTQSSINLYKSEENSCAYLEGEQSSSIYANPYSSPDWDLYTLLIQKGFRRSGEMIYRPNCANCRKCISVRLKVADFDSNRRFRRIQKKNQDIHTQTRKPGFTQEAFGLYKRYLATQHAGGDMDNPSEADFTNFLITDWSDSIFLESHLNGQLISVAVTDVVQNGLSSVYTFYDPKLRKRSPGIFSILSQIELCQKLNLPYLYLGYWISGCRKMEYKNDFAPLEYYFDEQWMDQTNLERASLR